MVSSRNPIEAYIDVISIGFPDRCQEDEEREGGREEEGEDLVSEISL